jgi:hypothetical protein
VVISVYVTELQYPRLRRFIMEFKVGDIVRVVSFDVFKKRLNDRGYVFKKGNKDHRMGYFTKPGAYSLSTARVDYPGGHTGIIREFKKHPGKNFGVIYSVEITGGSGIKPSGSGFVEDWLTLEATQNFNILD